MTENVPENTGITREIFTSLIEGSKDELTSYVNTELGNKLTAMQKELMSNSAHIIENKPINRVSSSVKGTSQFVDTLHKQVNGIWGTEFNAYVRENLKEEEQIEFFTGLNDIIKSRLTSSNRPVLFDEIIEANTHRDKIDGSNEIKKSRPLQPSDFEEGAKFGHYSAIPEDIKNEMAGALLIEGLFIPSIYTQGFMYLQFKDKTVTTLSDRKSLPTPNKENGFDTVFLCIQPQRHLEWGTSKAYILKNEEKEEENKYLDDGKPKWGNFDVYYDQTNGGLKYIIMDGSMSGARLGGKKTRGKNKKNSRKGRSRRRR